MFLEETKTSVIKRVVAFIYVNRLKVSDAVVCYNACNGMHTSYVETSMHELYSVWVRNPYEPHKERYYCMVLKCMAWIIRKALDQREVVRPDFPVRKFVPAEFHCPRLICCRRWIPSADGQSPRIQKSNSWVHWVPKLSNGLVPMFEFGFREFPEF